MSEQDEQEARYQRYIDWMRLTYNGRRGREQMPPEAQTEYDSLGFKTTAPPLSAKEREAAKQAYLEVTGRSGPEDVASS